eukprot:Nitzschia sp. Nitz4//scaffold158_size52425//45882//48003//NITZ4_006864-RA/size52425-processed-gene-0.42-mRNA-1//1//CDS//3329537528//962//frame0
MNNDDELSRQREDGVRRQSEAILKLTTEETAGLSQIHQAAQESESAESKKIKAFTKSTASAASDEASKQKARRSTSKVNNLDAEGQKMRAIAGGSRSTGTSSSNLKAENLKMEVVEPAAEEDHAAPQTSLDRASSAASSAKGSANRERASRRGKEGLRNTRTNVPGVVAVDDDASEVSSRMTMSMAGLSHDGASVNTGVVGANRVTGVGANHANDDDGAALKKETTTTTAPVAATGTLSESVTATAVSRDDLEDEVRRQIMSEVVTAEVVPIEHSESFSKEVKEEKRQGSSTLLIVAIACCLVLTGVVIGVVVALLGGGDDGEKSDALVDPPTTAPTQNPASNPGSNTNEDALMLLLSQHSDSVAELGTPQSKAFKWLFDNKFTPMSPLLLETFALVTFYFATDGDNWKRNDLWLNSNRGICEWYPRDLCEEPAGGAPDVGRRLGRQLLGDAAILQLDMSGNNLQGTIPPEIALLSDLDWLLLYDNPGLTGTIPTEIGLLSNLGDFFAGETSLTGTLPTELGGLDELKTFDMSFCTGITGNIPRGLWAADRIKTLNLEGIGLGGTLPDEGQSPQYVYLRDNQLTGSIPIDDRVDWKNMVELDLAFNELTGTIPIQLFANWEGDLEVLNLEGNDFSGPVPDEVCTSLEEILDETPDEEYEFSIDCDGENDLTEKPATSRKDGVVGDYMAEHSYFDYHLG